MEIPKHYVACKVVKKGSVITATFPNDNNVKYVCKTQDAIDNFLFYCFPDIDSCDGYVNRITHCDDRFLEQARCQMERNAK